MKKLLMGIAVGACTLAPLAAIASSASASETFKISACNEHDRTFVTVKNEGPGEVGVLRFGDGHLIGVKDVDHGENDYVLHEELGRGREVVLSVDGHRVAQTIVRFCA
jgi:hypothetical protein